MKKLFIALLLIASVAKAQDIHIDSVYHDGVKVTSFTNGDYVKVYMHPQSPNWANIVPNIPLHFACFGSQSPVWATTPAQMQDSGWAVTIHLYTTATTGLGPYTLEIYDAGNSIMSNYYTLNYNQSTGIEDHYSNKQISEIHYYNFNGQEVVNQTGLLIKKIVYSDKSVLVSKVFVQ